MKEATIYILAQLEDDQDIYWALGKYKATTSEGTFTLRPIQVRKVAQYGVLEADKTDISDKVKLPENGILLDNIIWTGRKYLHPKFTPKGVKKLTAYFKIQENYSKHFPKPSETPN